MVLNSGKLLLYDTKLLTIGHGTNFKSTAPSHSISMRIRFAWTSLVLGE